MKNKEPVVAGIVDLGFPMWPVFAEETFKDVLEPLKRGKVNYRTCKKGMEFEEARQNDLVLKVE